GTALTRGQVNFIKRYTDMFVIVFDGDQAGIAAAKRGFDLLGEQNLKVKVSTLSSGEDPDTFIRLHGREKFLEYIEKAIDIVNFIFDRTIQENDISTISGQVAAVNKLIPVLAKLSNIVERTRYIEILADKLKINQELLLEEIKKTLAKGNNKINVPRPNVSGIINKGENAAEKYLVQLLLKDNCYLESVFNKLGTEDFENPDYKSIIEILYNLYKEDVSFNQVNVIQYFSSERIRSIVSSLLVEEYGEDGNIEKIIHDCLTYKINNKGLKRRLILIKEEMQEAEKKQRPIDNELLFEYNCLLKEAMLQRI
ncbi:MAG: toprim domain-containing protein, partial [bacterium]